MALVFLLPATGRAQGQFVRLGPMPFSNAEAAAAELDGLIYLAGGFNGEEASEWSNERAVKLPG